MSDEGFREIQLNGKQLIFLFMAVTVVSVVIFLFGVLVGRGVRGGAETADASIADVAPDPGATAALESAAPPSSSSTGASDQSPAAEPAEELSYAERLLRDSPPEENLKPAAADAPERAPVVKEPVAERAPLVVEKAPVAQRPSVDKPAVVEKAPAPPPARESAPAPAVPAAVAAVQASDPSGPGFAVQVAAYRDRREADTLAKRLADKGYPAFVMDPVKGTSTTLFRVRVGKYKTLKDAEAVETRLQTTEQLTNAWIAR